MNQNLNNIINRSQNSISDIDMCLFPQIFTSGEISTLSNYRGK